MGTLTGTMANTPKTMVSTQGVGSSTLPREVVRLIISLLGDSIRLVLMEVISSTLVVKQVEGVDGQHSKVVVGPILDMLQHSTWEGHSYPWTPW